MIITKLNTIEEYDETNNIKGTLKIWNVLGVAKNLSTLDSGQNDIGEIDREFSVF